MIAKSAFTASDGSACNMFTIQNKNGLELRAIEFGAIVQSLRSPDRSGEISNIVLNYDTLHQYQQDELYMGALTGRFAGRIANGSFSIDGVTYQLVQNASGGNHLHGGLRGFNKALWKGEVVSDYAVKFTYISEDGEEGYPGELTSEVTYSLTDDNEWVVAIRANSNKTTVLNLVQHSYFNLAGNPEKSILDHELTVHADSFLPVNDRVIPTGEYRSVENTPFDFRQPKVIRAQASVIDQQLTIGNGIDHCWVLRESGLKQAAVLYDPAGGRYMEVLTTKPGILVYTGNFLTNPFAVNSGICLETQYFPDSPNQQNFPSAVLRPGEQYQHTTIFKLSVR